jgi:uncharacterized glyoxalase superfamily protein PhnB
LRVTCGDSALLDGRAEGERNIYPELRWPGGPAIVGWLANGFGFTTLIEIPRPDDATMHAEMRLGDGVIMLNGGSSHHRTWGDLMQATSGCGGSVRKAVK